MKVILQMALTANGMVALPNGDTPFISKIEELGFVKATKVAGVYVYGHGTFSALRKADAMPYPHMLNVVMTSAKLKNIWGPSLLLTNKKPREVLTWLAKLGYKTVLLGGSKLPTSFLKQKLVDEIVLDIEPELLGKGIALVAPSKLSQKLKLLSVKKFSQNEVQLRYKVLK
ncbi:MAG TPA: dihydrofolate reductase family protein [Candidatus Paceibacterota bacterium]